VDKAGVTNNKRTLDFCSCRLCSSTEPQANFLKTPTTAESEKQKAGDEFPAYGL